MTLTETRPADTPDDLAAPPVEHGVAAVIATGEHKRLGLLFARGEPSDGGYVVMSGTIALVPLRSGVAGEVNVVEERQVRLAEAVVLADQRDLPQIVAIR